VAGPFLLVGDPFAAGGQHMMISTGKLLKLVFKRVNRKDFGEFSMDSHMLGLLMEIDGKKSLSQIAQSRGWKLGDIQNAIVRLLELKLIAPVQATVVTVDDDFLDYLRLQLSHAVGPIAEILIEDAIADLGHSRDRFPTNQVAELVDLLAKEIQRDDRAMQFKKNIIEKIRQKGY
jgi:hypothetical protein